MAERPYEKALMGAMGCSPHMGKEVKNDEPLVFVTQLHLVSFLHVA